VTESDGDLRESKSDVLNNASRINEGWRICHRSMLVTESAYPHTKQSPISDNPSLAALRAGSPTPFFCVWCDVIMIVLKFDTLEHIVTLNIHYSRRK